MDDILIALQNSNNTFVDQLFWEYTLKGVLQSD